MGNSKHTIEELRERQALPMEVKVLMTNVRIHEWQCNGQFGYGKGVVSFSGGKDSTVLLHIARKLYPNIPAVFSNTGLEYPEIQRFVRKFDNVTIVQPKMRFDQVISTYGYPLIGKEVAEAIYYARRIRSQTVNVEREREREATGQRKRGELEGQRKHIQANQLEAIGNEGGVLRGLSRRAQREIAEQSSKDECPEPG